MEGVDPFTEEFKQKMNDAQGFTIFCKKCTWQLSYLHDINSFTAVMESVTEHLDKVHNARIDQ